MGSKPPRPKKVFMTKQDILKRDVMMDLNRYQDNFGIESTKELLFDAVILAKPEIGESMVKNQIEIANNMETYGGSFVKALSELVRRSDVLNFAKLQDAFPSYFYKYHPDNWGKK